ncbi:MAG: low-complexity tail membrane protein [Cyanobium sp.]
MNARSEPLLWLQLIAVGVLPLEALLLLLLLAGSDPGPVPALERLLCWGLGALLPAVALWRRPADVWSLLLLQTPLRARRPLQQRLSALQETPGLRLGLVSGSALLLALLWWSDEHAAIAGPFSPLAASPRLVGLLLAALLLALMLWQWQQLLQSLWLLSRGAEALATTPPLSTRDLESRRLCLGLPLLLVDPLIVEPPARTRPGQSPAPSSEPEPVDIPGQPLPAANPQPEVRPLAVVAEPPPQQPSAEQAQGSGPLHPQATEAVAGNSGHPPSDQPGPDAGDPTPSVAVAVAIEPEQGAEEGEGGDLDHQVG